jgi:hypothetical protein
MRRFRPAICADGLESADGVFVTKLRMSLPMAILGAKHDVSD